MHVLIAGGGVGGLCLAQGLRRAGISCAVYERSPGLTPGGYLLHMNADGGNGLRACLPDDLYDLYVRTSRPTPRRDVLVIQNHLGHELAVKPHLGPSNDPVTPHTTVHRRALCQIMLHGIEDRVRFGREVVGYRSTADGVTIELDNGELAHGDVLVAADGINSAVRRQFLPDVETAVLVRDVLLSRSPLTPAVERALPDAFQDSFVITVDPAGTLMAAGLFRPRHPFTAEMPVDAVEDYVSVSVEPAAAGIDIFAASGPELHDVMRKAVTDWHPGLQQLVDGVLPDTIMPKTTRMVLPTDPWSPGNVTVLGDAIHAMPPMLGDGANSALRDAASLTTALSDAARGYTDLSVAVGRYEEAMRARTYPLLREAMTVADA
ncbi:FAD-dependent oxidoreductase [Umezawaea sp. NPDC059074]|uniref:FAD-dependent oxidoreductase n=1 Tax=Umezawaea sp. NPDC059074 TaxID=3346716 RepID=UPI0036881F26